MDLGRAPITAGRQRHRATPGVPKPAVAAHIRLGCPTLANRRISAPATLRMVAGATTLGWAPRAGWGEITPAVSMPYQPSLGDGGPPSAHCDHARPNNTAT